MRRHGPSYPLQISPTGSDDVIPGLGAHLTFAGDWALGLDDRTTFGQGCTELGKADSIAAPRALWQLDLRGELPAIKAPTWVLCGSRDRVNLPAARAIAATIPGAGLRIEAGVGHLWNVEAPDRFNDALASMLAEAE